MSTVGSSSARTRACRTPRCQSPPGLPSDQPTMAWLVGFCNRSRESLLGCYPAVIAEAAADKALDKGLEAFADGSALAMPNFRGWVKVVARNFANRLAVEAGRPVLPLRGLDVPSAPVEADEDREARLAREAARREEVCQHLREALAGLAARQAAALWLTFAEGLSLREAARRLGVSPQTVSRAVRQAVQTLRAMREEIFR